MRRVGAAIWETIVIAIVFIVLLVVAISAGPGQAPK